MMSDKAPGKGRGKYAEAGDEATQDERLEGLAFDVANHTHAEDGSVVFASEPGTGMDDTGGSV